MKTPSGMAIADFSPSGAMLRMIAGFRISRAIYVAAKLGVADLLKGGPKSSEELAQLTGTHAPSLYRVMRALASAGVFDQDEQRRFTLTPSQRRYVAMSPIRCAPGRFWCWERSITRHGVT